MAYLAELRAKHAAALFLSTDAPVTTIGRGQLQGLVEWPDGVCFERSGNPDGPPALAQLWKAQHFSYWMTTMLPRASDFDLSRQFGGTRVGDGLGSRVDLSR
jgi:hypothetical protein